jgi:hypothetical protein
MGTQASSESSHSYRVAFLRDGSLIIAHSALFPTPGNTLRYEQQPERNDDSTIKQPPDGEDPEKGGPENTRPAKQEYGHCQICKGSGKTAAQCIYPRKGPGKGKPPCGHCNRRGFDAERCQGGLDQASSTGGGSGAAATIDDILGNIGRLRSTNTDVVMEVIKVVGKGRK